MSNAKPLTGAQLIAKSLREQGVQYAFGIVGIPVVEVALYMQAEGIKYYHCRNEQAASYAAAAVGYLTGRPGVALGVSGPGAIHCFAGAANAWSNCWPMIVIGGSSESTQSGTGSFQEAPQVAMAEPVCKLARMVETASRIPFHIEQAVRTSITGRPGACYLDFPGDVLRQKVPIDQIMFPPCCPDPVQVVADHSAVKAAVQLLQNAKRPLVIVGKGAAYARAEHEIARLLGSTNFPVLTTPMGKGTVSDADKRLVNPARSFALGGCDVVLLIGARLNWMLHFGLPPRWAPDVKVIQIDIEPLEMHQSVPTAAPLVGDAKAVCSQLCEEVDVRGVKLADDSAWWTQLRQKVQAGIEQNSTLAAQRTTPMNYYWPISQINARMPKDCIVIGEGDQTMNIGRAMLQNYLPRHRLDAGTFGTMGVGLPQVLAAAAVNPEAKIVAVEGDSAIGFSMAEFETLCRYRINAIVIVINNGGIHEGSSKVVDDPLKTPAPHLAQRIRYEKLADAFGGAGFFADTPELFEKALDYAFASDTRGPVLINCIINPKAGARPQTHASWLTVTDQKSKL